MKRRRLLWTVLCLTFAAAKGQTIQYSRETFSTPLADAVHLVANVSGYHHLLYLREGEKPRLYIFNPQLQLAAKEELPFRLKQNSDLQLLPFANHYLFYVHVPNTTLHQLFKIEKDGEAIDISDAFTKPADSAWNQSKATFQLANLHESLLLTAHTYFDALKKIGSRLVLFKNDFTVNKIWRPFFPFDGQTETLQQTILSGNDLLVLKTGRHDEKGHLLEVVKIDIKSGQTLSKTFAVGSNFFSNPTIRYNQPDSSYTLSSLVVASLSSVRVNGGLFICPLTQSLQEKVPMTLLRSSFRNNVTANFYLVNSGQPQWISTGNVAGAIAARLRGVKTTDIDNPVAMRIASGRMNWPENRVELNGPSGLRFTVVNQRLKPVADSVVANNGNIYDIQPHPFGRFNMNNKAYLVLIQNFSAKQRGLFLVTSSDKGSLATKALPVYDRYEYLLPQLQAVNDEYIILPYTYKGETGLVKISMKE